MLTQSLRRAVAATGTALLLAASFVGAQDESSNLRISRHAGGDRQNNRVTPTVALERSDAFRRIDPDGAAARVPNANRQRAVTTDRAAAFERLSRAASPQPPGAPGETFG